MTKRQNVLKSTLHFMQLKLVRAWASWVSIHQLLKLGTRCTVPAVGDV